MNRFFLYIAAATTILTAACNRPHEEEDPVIPVTGITHNLPATLELLVGATLTLEAAVEPAEAANQTVTWSTSDPNVVTVTPAGELTAITAGTATITAATDDGGFTATCEITVNEEVIPVTGITHNLPATLELLVGATLTFEAAVEPAEAANQTVTWSTSDAQVATINTEGELTAIAPGTVTITATTDDGGFTATCTVTVTSTDVITMTTLASEVSLSFRATGSGNIIIDWGDGLESKIFHDSYYEHWLSHSYSSASEHRITITGVSIFWFSCENNQLTSLDVNKHTGLGFLYCRNNQLTTLDVSGAVELRELYCTHNQLATLGVNIGLANLYCHNNQLTKLDMSGIFPTRVSCYNNQLTAAALNDLFSSLQIVCYNPPAISTKNDTFVFHVWIDGNPGTNDCDISIAREKCWWVIPGSSF